MSNCTLTMWMATIIFCQKSNKRPHEQITTSTTNCRQTSGLWIDKKADCSRIRFGAFYGQELHLESAKKVRVRDGRADDVSIRKRRNCRNSSSTPSVISCAAESTKWTMTTKTN